MKNFRTVIGFAAVLVAGTAWADDASKMAKTQELLQVTKMEQGFKQMLDQAQTMLKAQTARQKLAEADKAVVEQKTAQIVAEQLSWDKLKAQFLKAYADTFTEEELDATLAFYKSAAGQAWIAKSSEVRDKARVISQQAMQDAQAQIRKVIEQAPPKDDAK
jgi:uncharacterized protein